MHRREITAALVIIALLAGMLAAALHLFRMGMVKGDLHPPHSTHRSAPDGLKLLYESLARMDTVSISRHYRPLRWLTGAPDRTLVIAGIESDDAFRLDRESAQALDRFMESGGRIVLALNYTTEWLAEKDDHERNFVGPPEPENPEDDPARAERRPVDLLEHWGFRVVINPRYWAEDEMPAEDENGVESEAGEMPIEAVYQGNDPAAPSGFACWYDMTGLEFTDEAWSIDYRYLDEPVVATRRFGDGRLRIVANMHILRNQGLIYDADPEWIAWVLGHAHEIIFDESHLGVVEQRGIMWLALRHDLEWVVAAFCLGALLYIWRNATPLPPRRSTDRVDATPAHAEAAIEGLHGLIIRFIPPAALLGICWDVWRRKNPQYEALDEARRTAVEALIEREGDGLNDAERIRRYRRIRALLKERST